MNAHDHGRGAHGHDGSDDELTVAEHWERRYAGADRVWSGRPNDALVAVAPRPPLDVGRTAVDLGCGEGGDAIWLAEQGWHVVAVDISTTAVRRGREAANDRGLDGAIEWVVADLSDWRAPDGIGLVSACFLQSTRELDRVGILRAAASRVAIGGHLLSVTHAEPPPWHPHPDDPGITPESELADLALDPLMWAVERAEIRNRIAAGPDGEPTELRDGVVLVRRIS